MKKFNLKISFTYEQLDSIYKTNSNVFIAKQGFKNHEPNVVWQSFQPFEFNSISWEEEYGIYAAFPQNASGTILEKLSKVPVGVTENNLYTLEKSGVISGPKEGNLNDCFALTNHYQKHPFMAVGLYQGATVNGVKILENVVSFQYLLKASTAFMYPSNIIFIWIQSEVKNNSTLVGIETKVISPKTQLNFKNENATINLAYHSTLGKFYQVQSF